jgi:diamine N-acetyltransferase
MRGILGDGERVGFVMLSEVTEHHPDPFLWRLLIDRMHQRRGIGQRVLSMLTDRLRADGASQLVTSYGSGPGTPAAFYHRLGFVPTGDLLDGETVAALDLRHTP